jgi:hypothetical protein
MAVSNAPRRAMELDDSGVSMISGPLKQDSQDAQHVSQDRMIELTKRCKVMLREEEEHMRVCDECWLMFTKLVTKAAPRRRWM